jgi:hypothetical protein
MSLQTAHLASLAIETKIIQGFFLNFFNVIVFAIVVFRNMKIDSASFWEIGMSCSIFASALVSMLIYSYMSGQLNQISI